MDFPFVSQYLDPPVDHARLLYGVGAALVEGLEELMLPLDVTVQPPTPTEKKNGVRIVVV